VSQKTTYYHPDGSVSFEKTLIVTGTNLELRVQQLERENAALRAAAAIEEERSLYWRAAEDKLKRENTELRDFVERHENALRLLRIWAAKPMHGTNCDDLREETLAFLKTQ
jgi:hypothetical protein